MPNDSPYDPNELPPPLPGAEVPPPLPGVSVPPPLPGVTEGPARAVPIVNPVAKPVARAVPVQAMPTEEPRTERNPSTTPTTVSTFTPRNNEQEHHRAQPQIKLAMIVIAGFLLFGCCGIGVVGFAFYKVTQSVANGDSVDDRTFVPEKGPNPPEPKERPNPKTGEPLNPPILPAGTANALQVPSPQGMKGLQAYLSFDSVTLREDVTREKLPTNQTGLLISGVRNRANRFVVTSVKPSEPPSFVVDFTKFVDSFRFKDDSPFTISLWTVALAGNDSVAFALTQNSLERGPKLLIKSNYRQIDVELFCDPNDSEKKFVRTRAFPNDRGPEGMHHIVLTRSKDGTLAVYVDSKRIDDAPADSLPARQPVELSFKRAGFAMRLINPSSLDLDEFSFFDRCLDADEIRTLAGRSKK